MKQLLAKYEGFCRVCDKPIPPGQWMGRWMGTWAHRECVQAWREYESNQLKILAGEGYRSRRPAEWRIRQGGRQGRTY